ncbi:MAG: hypothetical protein GVY06_01540 [Alphaproteobacteria bacterium]|jgi:hypothetical protein|nr:hypothetical protein [Alphaproteobacteria bacterium]
MPGVSANGIEIVYEETGQADAPALLLACGFSGQMTRWPDSLEPAGAAI